MQFEGCVLVTGAAGALGRAVVAHFAARGAALALLDRDAEALAAQVREVPGIDALPLATNLLDPAAVAAAVGEAANRFGGIAAAVHLTGGFTMGEAVHETTAATWQHMLDLNVNTMLHSAAAVVPVMRRARRGRIVNVGAMSALRGAAHMGAYIASKSALMRLTESMSPSCATRASTSTRSSRASSTRPPTASPCRTPTRRAGSRPPRSRR